jgi:hypothetical protein
MGDAIVEELRQRVGIGRRIIIIIGAPVIIRVTIILPRWTWMFRHGGCGSEPKVSLPTTTYQKEAQSQQKYEFLHGYLLTMQTSRTFPVVLLEGPA